MCTTVRAGHHRQCDNVTTINGSQIAATGLVTSDEEEQTPFAQAITGGTGVYRDAHGRADRLRGRARSPPR